MLNQGRDIDVAVLAYSFKLIFESLTKLEGAEKDGFLRRVRLKNVARRFAAYNWLIEDLLRKAVYYRIWDGLVAGSWEVEGRA